MSDEATATSEPVDEPRERPRTVPVGAFVVAVMVAAALGILALVALSVDDGGSGADETEDARLAAGRFAERFLTFEDDALDEWKDDVLALSTGGFAEEVDDVEDGLRRLIAEAELDAEAEVTEIFIGDVDRGAAQAVLVYDRTLTSSSGTRDETDRYMQLSMLLVDGEWLVDNVIDIATAGDAGTAGDSPAEPATSSTTATSAPG